MKKIFLLLFIVFFACKSNAQNSLEEYKKQYPDFNELVINDIQSYEFTIESNKLKVIQNNHFESIILTDNGIQGNKESFTYSELVKLLGYEAYTVINDNGKEKKIKVTQTN
jgi:hypothetical protein